VVGGVIGLILWGVTQLPALIDWIRAGAL